MSHVIKKHNMDTGWMTGIEPATSGTTNLRSNRLSYTHRADSILTLALPCSPANAHHKLRGRGQGREHNRAKLPCQPSSYLLSAISLLPRKRAPGIGRWPVKK